MQLTGIQVAVVAHAAELAVVVVHHHRHGEGCFAGAGKSNWQSICLWGRNILPKAVGARWDDQLLQLSFLTAQQKGSTPVFEVEGRAESLSGEVGQSPGGC